MGERQEAQLVRERGRSREQLEELRERKEETISQLTSQLLEMKKSVRGNKERSRCCKTTIFVFVCPSSISFSQVKSGFRAGCTCELLEFRRK